MTEARAENEQEGSAPGAAGAPRVAHWITD